MSGRRMIDHVGDGVSDGIADWDRVCSILAAVAPKASEVVMLTIPGDPKSKARPRVNPRGGVWTDSAAEEEAVAMRLRVARGSTPSMTDGVAFAAVFFRNTRQRRDVDNMLKLVLDAATKAGIWVDDRQVVALIAVEEWDAKHPRTLAAWAPHETSFPMRPPRKVCETCHEEFLISYGGYAKRFCSRACKATQIRQEKVRPGQGQGPKGQPATACRDCGKPVSKRSYIRCRACWAKARTAGVS